MDNPAAAFETLKEILRHARRPGQLDGHPWTRSLFVREALSGDPGLQAASPGGQLVGALAGLFRELQPASPPRRGLRLDPRWGEFGLLAALYFAPFNHGKPFPSTQLEAWRRIDPAILYFVYGQPAGTLGAEQVAQYQLVGDELEFGSASTLSDWHRKGLQRLAEAVLNRERYLSRSSAQPSCLLEEEAQAALVAEDGRSACKRAFGLKRALLLALAILLLAGLALAGGKAWRIYERGRRVYQRAVGLHALLEPSASLRAGRAAGPDLVAFQGEWVALREEIRPLLWLGPALGWLPAHGGDLAYAPEWSALADGLVEASVLGYQAALPVVERLESTAGSPDPAALTALLVDAQPQLEGARQALDRALAARSMIQAGRLSPRAHALLVEELDPLLALAGEGLSFATALPAALGATEEGPKTYLLLALNEDERRPTGGFITSVGSLVLHNGRVISLQFEGVDSDDQEDWSRPYPAAPWQLQEYMNSPVMILRDSSWFTDYPTAAAWAEYLYAYKHAHSVDGVIAFDQRFLVILLAQLGPLETAGAPYPLTADNVMAYMREAKLPPEASGTGQGEARPPGWYRKEFIAEISAALLAKISAGDGLDWRALSETVVRALEERHLLLQFDHPQLAELLAARGWDNALRPGDGDTLMVVDTNVGFNKTDALVQASLAYDVDLTDPSAPQANLVVTHTNQADAQVPCIHWETDEIPGEEMYPINRCYWDYLRVYKQPGVKLLKASPHDIPGEWLILQRDVPARVDELEEEVPGVRAFGTLLVVPGGQSWNTGFTFSLPAAALQEAGAPGQWLYRLKVQKQPGTLAVPLTLRVHLPARAELLSASLPATGQGDNLLFQTDLRTDVVLEVVFRLP